MKIMNPSLYYIGRPCKHHGPNALRLKSNRTCVQCQREKIKNYKKVNKPKIRESERRLYNQPMTVLRYIKRSLKSARGRARSKQLPFTLTLDYLLSIWTNECPVFGIKFNVAQRGRGKLKDRPSLDRVVPESGYVEGNVVFISYHANTMKNNGSLQEIIQLANWLTQKYAESPFVNIGFNLDTSYNNAYSFALMNGPQKVLLDMIMKNSQPPDNWRK